MKKIQFIALSMSMLLALVPKMGAQDEEIKKKIADCASIKEDATRLACYDRIAKDLLLTKPLPNQSPVGTGKWIINSETNPVDDSKTEMLTLTADEGKSNMGQPVILAIRCKSKETHLFVAWGDYLGDKAVVLVRIGDQKATTNNWTLSSNSQATFHPGNTVQFIKSLLEHNRLVVQVTPYNENPILAVFDISGLSEAIKPLRQTCGW
jgi:type VI secretion system protein VasI